MENFMLSKPFAIQDGNEITVFQLDFDNLSTADFRQIKKLEAQISDAGNVDATDLAKPKNLSFEFQLASGFLAAVKGTSGLLISDFTRLPMADALNLAQCASFFWFGVV